MRREPPPLPPIRAGHRARRPSRPYMRRTRPAGRWNDRYGWLQGDVPDEPPARPDTRAREGTDG